MDHLFVLSIDDADGGSIGRLAWIWQIEDFVAPSFATPLYGYKANRDSRITKALGEDYRAAILKLNECV